MVSRTTRLDGQALPRLGRQGKAQELIEALEIQLRSGAIAAGEKLPSESTIMQSSGVSRGVVREALSHLAASGLVTTRHGIGTFALAKGREGQVAVRSPSRMTLAAMLDLLELRASVEPEAAALAAVRHKDEDLAAMRRALAHFSANLASAGDTVAPDHQFHVAIAHATYNKQFIDLIAQLTVTVIPSTRVSSTMLEAEVRQRHLQRVNQEHLDIFEAIVRREPDGARAAMRLHLIGSRERQKLAYQSIEFGAQQV